MYYLCSSKQKTLSEASGAAESVAMKGDAEAEAIGKKHALKKYDQFALNTSWFYPSCAISRNF